MLKNKEFPEEVIKSEFHLSTFEYVLKIIQLIFFGLVTAFMCYVDYLAIADLLKGGTDLGTVILGLIITLLPTWLFIKPLKKLIFNLKIRKLYKSVK